MNVTDVALLVAGSYFIIRGAFKGFSGELLSLIGIIGGFYCSLTFYSPVAGFLSKQFGISTLASSAFTMLAIFMLIFSVCAISEKCAKKILKGTNLTWLDKFGGATAGFIKIYLISLLLLVAGMVMAPLSGDAWVRESRALVAAAKTWPYVYPLLDRVGVLPDLSELQAEAKEYIMQQASRSLFERYGTAVAGNVPIDPSAISADVLSDPSMAEKVRELTGDGLLDFFLGWGKD